MRRFWTDEKDAMLRRDYPTKHLGSLAVRLGTTVPGLKARAKKLGLHRAVNVHHPWTDRQLAYLRKHYADTPMAEMIRGTGHCRDSIYNKADALGLRKSLAAKQANGLRAASSPRSQACRFQKGHQPYNKGKREHEFRSPSASARCARTQFKKGDRPKNARPVGYDIRQALRQPEATLNGYFAAVHWFRRYFFLGLTASLDGYSIGNYGTYTLTQFRWEAHLALGARF